MLRSSVTYDGEDMSNIITKVVMPAQIEKDVCKRDDIGQQEYARFVEVSVWARMKKVQLKMWESARKSVKHKVDDQVMELKDDRSLFAHMLIVARSQAEINLKECSGQHELTS